MAWDIVDECQMLAEAVNSALATANDFSRTADQRLAAIRRDLEGVVEVMEDDDRMDQ